MQTLIIGDNVFDASKWETLEVENIHSYVEKKYPITIDGDGAAIGGLPHTARFYEGYINNKCDITPKCQEEIDYMNNSKSVIFLIIFPADPISLIVSVVVGIAAVASTLLLLPKVPNLRNNQAASSNNSLANRTNQPRINARIKDIFGQVKDYPDLIGPPITMFEGENEVEIADMCIGRGEYLVEKIRDGETLIQSIPGSSVEIYAPNTSAQFSAFTPQLSIGLPIDKGIYRNKKLNGVNGQTLNPSNAGEVINGFNNIKFKYPNEIITNQTTSNLDGFFGDTSSGFFSSFSQAFEIGQILKVTRASFTKKGISDSYQISGKFSSNSIIMTSSISGLKSGDFIKLSRAIFTTTSTTTDVQITVVPVVNNTIGFNPEIDTETGAIIGGSITGDILVSASSSTDRATVTANTNVLNLNGTYQISNVSENGLVITLINPFSINSEWNNINSTFPDTSETPFKDLTIDVIQPDISVNLNGSYTITNITNSIITLSNPSNINNEWEILQNFPSNQSDFISPTLSVDGGGWVGPFIIEEGDNIVNNFVALQGLWKDDGEKQISASVGIQIEITPLDNNDNANGSVILSTITLYGSSEERDRIGKTSNINFVGRCSIRAQRITPADLEFEGTVVDEVKWLSSYSRKRMTQPHFGNVTTVRSKTINTPAALSIKDRKLSAIVTRKLPVRLSDNTFDLNDLQPTKDFADILSFVALDNFIGRRSLDQIDVQNIYQTRDEILSYFTHDNSYDGSDFVEFSYTFDNENVSFEETVNTICSAVNCVAFRQWNKIRVLFEKQENNSSMVFSHRNKIPKSETRTYKFGIENNYDGVELTFVSPKDDTEMILKVPDNNISNPKKIKTIGVRNERQAYVIAWRIWNKLLYSNISTEFTSTAEGNIVKRNDNIIVSDNTTPITFDGEILEQQGLTLKLSQSIQFQDNETYYIAVQHINKTTEIVQITQSDLGDNYVLLNTPLTYVVSTSDTNYSKSSFIISKEDTMNSDKFIVVENRISSTLSSTISAINYDNRYYANDLVSDNAPELDVMTPSTEPTPTSNPNQPIPPTTSDIPTEPIPPIFDPSF